MLMMMSVAIPVEAGNKAVQDHTLGQIVQKFMAEHKPESAYFTTRGGERCALFFVDMATASVMPQFAEPFFAGLNARIDFTPVMTPKDLAEGLGQS